MPTVRLDQIALARSGDKGSSANIGVVARRDGDYEILRAAVTAERVKEFFADLSPASVTRYELPTIKSLNFVLAGVLGGVGAGGSVSLRIDAQGKALGQAILDMEIEIPDKISDNNPDKPGGIRG
jgi:hypothetical protein